MFDPVDTDDEDENVVDALQQDLEPSVLPTLRDESDALLVRSGPFAVLSSTSDDEACAVVVRCSSECEDHSRVAIIPVLSRGVQEVASHPM